MKIFKTPLDDLKEESERLSLDARPTEDMPELTQQNAKNETDINVIVKRFRDTGNLPTLNLTPLYADFSNAGDFTEAQNMLLAANQAFMELPAELRAKFGNNPARFIAWSETEEGREAIRTEFGAEPDEPPTPVPQAAPEPPTAGLAGGAATPPAPPSK